MNGSGEKVKYRTEVWEGKGKFDHFPSFEVGDRLKINEGWWTVTELGFGRISGKVYSPAERVTALKDGRAEPGWLPRHLNQQRGLYGGMRIRLERVVADYSEVRLDAVTGLIAELSGG